MTEWHSPGDAAGDAHGGAADPADAPDAPLAGGPPPASVRPRNRRQLQLLVLAGVLGAATVVLLLVVLLTGGSDAPVKGSPEAAVDQFAAALRSGASAQVVQLACPSARSYVLTGVRPVLGTVTGAQRQGSASVNGGVAVARLALSGTGKNNFGTVALQRAAGTWCIAGFVASPGP